MSVTEIAAGAPLDANRPWPGLDAFSEALQAYFFGRGAETDELFRRIRGDTVTLLFGQSGLGKTSLLRAGLAPRLRAAGFLPVFVRLDFAEGAPSPAAQVKAELEREAAAAGAEFTPIGAEESLWAYFHRVDRELMSRAGEPLTPVLIFDQFEEMFTLGLSRDASRAASQSFLIELAELIENRPPESFEREIEADEEVVENYHFDRQDYRLVIALREDFLAQLDSFRIRAPSIGRNRFRLRRMTGRQGLDAVLKPLPGLIEPELAEEIVRFVGRANPEDAFGAGAGGGDGGDAIEVEPPLLSLVCRELNERRLALGLDRITPDLLAGNRESIIQSFYETALADQLPAVREFVEDELLSESGYRESVSLDRARRLLAAANVPPEALDTLVRRRLLRVEERLDIARVEIIHDVLTPVIRASRDSRHLRQAEAAAAARERELRHARRRTQYAYGAAVIMAVLLVVAAGLGVWAYRSNQRAEQNFNEAVETADFLVKDVAERIRPLAGVQQNTVRAILADAEQAFDKLGAKAPSSPYLRWRRAEMLIDFVHVYQDLGDTTEAEHRATTARDLMQGLTVQDPKNDDWQYSLARAHIAMGDTLCQVVGPCTGNYGAALVEYRAALDQSKRPEVSNIDKNTGWASIRSVCDERVGDVLKAQSDYDGALAAYEDGLDVEKKLMANEPNYALWQSNLAWTYTKTGGLLSTRDDYDGALTNYREALKLRKALVQKTPGNTEWQRELSVSQIDIGDALKGQKHYDEALASYRDAVAVRKSLARRDPDNTQWQRDLSIADGRLGMISQLQGNLDEALAYYRDDLTINEELLQKDPGNGLWQRDVYWTEGKISEVLRAKGDIPGALIAIRVAEKIAVHLKERNPASAEAVSDISYIEGQLRSIASRQLAAGDAHEAVVTDQEMLAVTRKAHTADPNSDDAKYDIAIAAGDLAWYLLLDRQPREALKAAEEAHTLDPSLIATDINRADALLVLGHFDDARAIYAAHKDETTSGGKAVADIIREDFAQMRKFGIDTPDMKRIEALLGS